MCGEEGYKHTLLGSSIGSKCGCLNSSWLQQYAGDYLGMDNMCGVSYPWSCTVCMDSRKGLQEHCGITAKRHMEEILLWLTDLMANSGDGNIPIEDLEICDKDKTFNILTKPHGRVDQGFIIAGWRNAKVDTDKCQCTLVQATDQIDLSATNSQPKEQDITKEGPKGPLWGSQNWAKEEVCSSMITPLATDTRIFWDPEESLCVKQWSKCKTLTINRLEGFFPGGVKNVLEIVDRNCLILDILSHKAKEVVALSLNLYSIRSLSENVKAAMRTLHPDLKDVEV